MVESLNLDNKLTLVNAPAGSGKTTLITDTVKELVKKTDKEILCITYTNRAADQLSNTIEHENIEIGTIHSFIGNFTKQFFKLKDVIEFYLETYLCEIDFILKDNSEKNLLKKERYAEKYNIQLDQITMELIKENIKFLEYSETPYNSYLYGRLSHDELLIFTEKLFSKYPKLQKMMSYRYAYIFIDEFQDTSSNILNLFYKISLEGDTKLILLGDEMQQIYPEALGDFSKKIKCEFQKDFSLNNNWRSQQYIVEIMNKLYFDSRYIQKAKNEPINKPVINILSDLNEIEFEDDVLQLVLLNSDLFKGIDAYNLYRAYQNNLYRAYQIRYPQHHKYKVKDILSDLTLNNYDDLMRLLFFILKICDLYEEKKFTQLIDLSKKPTFFNNQVWNIKNHLEKIQLNYEINNLVLFIKKDICVDECLEYLSESKLFIKASINEVIENIFIDEQFKEKIIKTKFKEIINCYQEAKKPKFSTQHAVKGEGHEKVAIKISDGNNASVNVKMYFFLELFSKNLFDYFKIKEMCEKIVEANETFIQKTSIKASSSKLNKELFNTLKKSCDELIENLEQVILLDKRIYSEFYENIFLKYKTKPGVSNFKNCIRESRRIIAAMLAYKLFYVGCSRAKKELSVYLSAHNISNYRTELISKFEEIGFEILINTKYENVEV